MNCLRLKKPHVPETYEKERRNVICHGTIKLGLMMFHKRWKRRREKQSSMDVNYLIRFCSLDDNTSTKTELFENGSY